MWPLGLCGTLLTLWSCLFRGKVARMLGVHREVFLSGVNMGSGNSRSGERLNPIAKVFKCIGIFFKILIL